MTPQNTSINSIRAAALDALHAADRAVDKAIMCGLMLLEQKTEIGHGAWLPWLEKNLPELSHDRASRWMEAARSCLQATSIDISALAVPPSHLLSLPAAELSESQAGARQLLLDFTQGKTIKDCLGTIMVEGEATARLKRVINGRTHGGFNGEDRKAWDAFIAVKLKDMTSHLSHWKSFKGGQTEIVENKFAAAVEKWPTPVLEFLRKQIAAELKTRA